MTSHQVCDVRRDKTFNLRQQFAPHTTFGSVMLNPFASLRVNSAKQRAIFPHCLSLQMRGFFVSLRMTGGGVILYE
jgi:hypothetical protein